MAGSPRWLSTLIQLRRQDRDQCRLRLEEALQATSVLKDKEASLIQQLAQTAQSRRIAAGEGACDVSLLLAAQRYQAILQAEQDALGQQSELIGQEVERRRAALMEAEKQVRVLERLSERMEQRARQEANGREVKRLDELATTLRKAKGDR